MGWQQDQQWLWQQILAGDTDPVAADARIHAGNVPVGTRLAIYAGGYRLRLLECMRAAFPLLQAALGERLFDRFALDYLDARPSRSYTLHDLGAGFAAHLQATRPTNADESGDWVDFMIALTEFERVLSEVYDGPGDEHDLHETLRIAKSLRLLKLSHPVHESLRAHQRAAPVLALPARSSFLAIVRQSYRVRVEPVTPAEHQLLQQAQSGPLDLVRREVRAGVGEAGLARWYSKMHDRGILLGRYAAP